MDMRVHVVTGRRSVATLMRYQSNIDNRSTMKSALFKRETVEVDEPSTPNADPPLLTVIHQWDYLETGRYSGAQGLRAFQTLITRSANNFASYTTELLLYGIQFRFRVYPGLCLAWRLSPNPKPLVSQ